MNALSPSFVALAVAVLGAPTAVFLIHRGFAAAHEERRLRYAKEGEELKMRHEEKMADVKLVESRGALEKR